MITQEARELVEKLEKSPRNMKGISIGHRLRNSETVGQEFNRYIADVGRRKDVLKSPSKYTMTRHRLSR